MCDSAPNLRPFQYSPKYLFLMVFWEKGRRDWRPLIFSEVLQSRCCSQALNAESPWVKNATPSQFNVCPCRCFPLREEPRVRIRLPPAASRANFEPATGGSSSVASRSKTGGRRCRDRRKETIPAGGFGPQHALGKRRYRGGGCSIGPRWQAPQRRLDCGCRSFRAWWLVGWGSIPRFVPILFTPLQSLRASCEQNTLLPQLLSGREPTIVVNSRLKLVEKCPFASVGGNGLSAGAELKQQRRGSRAHPPL
jgi:hypothetical protein